MNGNWKVDKHKLAIKIQEGSVYELAKGLAEYGGLTSSYEFEERFKQQICWLKKRNGYKAEQLYKLKIIDTYKLELWKMTITGDEKYKIATFTYYKQGGADGK